MFFLIVAHVKLIEVYNIRYAKLYLTIYLLALPGESKMPLEGNPKFSM